MRRRPPTTDPIPIPIPMPAPCPPTRLHYPPASQQRPPTRCPQTPPETEAAIARPGTGRAMRTAEVMPVTGTPTTVTTVAPTAATEVETETATANTSPENE